MTWEQIASGGVLDASEIADYEGYINEGQRGRLELGLRIPVSQSIVSQLESQLRQRGVEGAKTYANSSKLSIEFRKGFPWLAVIAAVILGIIVLAILITGWRLFREVITVVPEPFQPWVVGAIVVIAGVVAFSLVARRAR